MAKSSAAKNTSLQLPPLCGHDRKAYWWAWHETPTLHVAAVDVAVYFRRLFCRLSPQQQQQQAEACNVCEFVYCNCLLSDGGREGKLVWAIVRWITHIAYKPWLDAS